MPLQSKKKINTLLPHKPYVETRRAFTKIYEEPHNPMNGVVENSLKHKAPHTFDLDGGA